MGFVMSMISKTRSKLTSALVTSTRAFVKAVSGRYTRTTKRLNTAKLPIVIVPLMTIWPPIQ